jgi:tetratricopeptide (TPR) repeat protein
MTTDQSGLEISCEHAATAVLFDDTVTAYLSFSKDVGKYAKALLTAEPNMPLANCLMGYFFQLMGTRALTSRAQRCLETAQGFAGATPREQQHAAALEAWLGDDLNGAAQHWESILVEHPRDLLAAKLAHFMHFYLGDSIGIRDSIARVLPAWSEQDAAYGYLLAMYAFGLEEAGDYAQAEAYGRQAVAMNNNDIWGIHAVAHVLEMQDRSQEGIDWVEELQPSWSESNNFRYHVAWHGALFHIDRGEPEHALKLYDETVWDPESNEYLDLCNDASLLLRLDMAGLDTGHRWRELAEVVSKHTQQHIFNFIDPHYVAALAAGNELEAAEAFVDALHAELATDWNPQDTYLQVADHIGLTLARAMVAYAQDDHRRVVDLLLPVRYRVQRIGGSHAQRDLFSQVLIDAAVKSNQRPLARSLLAERVALRPNNIVTLKRYADLLEMTNDPSSATVRERLAELTA